MATIQTTVAQFCSLSLRLLSYLFLRWALVPFFPAIVFTLFAIYIPSFVSSYIYEPRYDVVEEDLDVIVRETTVKEDGAPGELNGEEVDIRETLIVEERPLQGWQTLLYGTPNPKSLALTVATVLINVACVAMVADRYAREHSYTGADLSFARVGYVSDVEAKILIREPDQSKLPLMVEMRLSDPVPPFDDPVWKPVGGVKSTSNATDYTTVVSVLLKPGKQRVYQWRTSNGHSGKLTAAPKPGWSPDLYNGQFTFLSTSCIVSRLPYNPLDHPLAIPGMRYLANLLPSLNANFMLFLGDFIYVDVPRWWGKEVEDYRQKYRQVYASPDWLPVAQNLSWLHVLDDHEISNDWSSTTTGVYKTAVEPWHHYHAAPNPPQAKKAGTAVARPRATYFQFTQGPASFFLLDTRKHRSDNNMLATSENKTMLGAAQLEDLLAFLARPEPRGVKWKVVASSVPFTKNWRVNTKDTWGGFLVERRKVLEAMWDAGAKGYGVVVLSGDRHEFAATKFPPPEGGAWPDSAAVHEFSASPLSQFYSPIPSYRQTDGGDVEIKYINKGNSKFGAITIETLDDGAQSTLKYRLFVDGVETWNTVIMSPSASPGAVSAQEKTPDSLWQRLKAAGSGAGLGN